jgi:hypothetical protein
MKNTSPITFAACLITFSIAVTISCTRDPFKTDLKGIQTNIEITRFEKMLFSIDPSEVEITIPKWEKEFGEFFNHFCYITNIGFSNSPGFSERLKAFITSKPNYQLYKRTIEVFPDLNILTSKLNEGFRHYSYHFPGKPIPKVYTYVAGFGQSAITDDSLFAIGLDKYLGKNEPLYRQAGMYDYLLVNMHPGKIPSDCMNYWSETEFIFNDSVNNLVANMIYKGRILYFTKSMLPDEPDSLNWGFSGENLEYLASSEKSMWAYLVEHKLLFNTDRFTINKFILEGPFTKDFGRESPARAAVWLGYRIVDAYMSKNPATNLKMLMEERNYLNILNQSRYNP